MVELRDPRLLLLHPCSEGFHERVQCRQHLLRLPIEGREVGQMQCFRLRTAGRKAGRLDRWHDERGHRVERDAEAGPVLRHPISRHAVSHGVDPARSVSQADLACLVVQVQAAKGVVLGDPAGFPRADGEGYLKQHQRDVEAIVARRLGQDANVHGDQMTATREGSPA